MPTIPRKQTPDPRRKARKRDRPQDKRYWTSQWRKARLSFIKHNPVCNECGRVAQVVDHIEPVRLGGDFWNSSNWQPLCTSCHNAKSGREAHEG